MGTYQHIVVEDLVKHKEVQWCYLRQVSDLPQEIIGDSAIWYQPDLSKKGQVKQPSYHVPIGGEFYPIELVNGTI